MPALAAAGYRAVAVDMRGYGRSDRPLAAESYDSNQQITDVLAKPDIPLPWPWLSQEDFDYYVNEYERTGPETACIGGLDSYRIADRNWEIGAQYADANIDLPTLFISGEQDPVLQMIDPQALEIMKQRCSDLRGIEIIADAGHFVQQEQPDKTNAALLEFLRSL